MKQSEFLHELKVYLEEKLAPEELKDILSDYESFFISGKEEGKSEDEIAAELGSPAFLAQSLLEEPVKKKTVQLNKRITNPGRRMCAYALDAIIALIPSFIWSFALGSFVLPFVLFITFPSPLVGSLTYVGIGQFIASPDSTVFPVKTYTQTIDTRTGQIITQEEHQQDGRHPSPMMIPVFFMFSLAFYLFYSFVCALLFRGQTLGKKLMRIQVRYANVEQMPMRVIFYRELLGKMLINSIPLVPIVSIFTILFTKEHKALHDMLADTVVSDV